MIEIKNLHVEVEGNKILKGVNLEVKKGETHAIMGPNGSGKSTLAQVLAGHEDYDITEGSIDYLGKDLLEMDVDEALKFFENIPSITKKLKTLQDVGLGYIHLGQQATTLSGGEAQRIKLSTELSKMSTTKTVYILDEPTTGLHFEDIRILLRVLQKLVDRGNTVIIIEHNLDVIKSSDWVIDLGPEGGDDGGEVIAIGTPEQIIKNIQSYTGRLLNEIINP